MTKNPPSAGSETPTRPFSNRYCAGDKAKHDNAQMALSVGGKLIAGMDREGDYINLRLYAKRLSVKEAVLLCEDIQQMCKVG